MKYLLSILLLFIHLLGVVAQNKITIDNETRRIREEFQDRKFGIFLHWGIYSMLADGEWVMHNRHLDRIRCKQNGTDFLLLGCTSNKQKKRKKQKCLVHYLSVAQRIKSTMSGCSGRKIRHPSFSC